MLLTITILITNCKRLKKQKFSVTRSSSRVEVGGFLGMRSQLLNMIDRPTGWDPGCDRVITTLSPDSWRDHERSIVVWSEPDFTLD